LLLNRTREEQVVRININIKEQTTEIQLLVSIARNEINFDIVHTAQTVTTLFNIGVASICQTKSDENQSAM